MRPSTRVIGDEVAKAFVWFVWLARNDCIFNAKVLTPHAIMVKTDHMLLSWFSVAADGLRVKLDDTITSIRRSLEFLGPRSEGVVDAPTLEED